MDKSQSSSFQAWLKMFYLDIFFFNNFFGVSFCFFFFSTGALLLRTTCLALFENFYFEAGSCQVVHVGLEFEILLSQPLEWLGLQCWGWISFTLLSKAMVQ